MPGLAGVNTTMGKKDNKKQPKIALLEKEVVNKFQ